MTIVLIAIALTSCPPASLLGGPELAVLFEGSAIEHGGLYDFGEVEVYLFGTRQVFNIINTGLEDLLLPSGITVEGTDSAQFRIVMHPAELIPPGVLSNFIIVFEPIGDAGPRSATVSIESNVEYLVTAFTFTITGICIT